VLLKSLVRQTKQLVDKNSLLGTKSGKRYGGVMQKRVPQYLVRSGHHINYPTKNSATKKMNINTQYVKGGFLISRLWRFFAPNPMRLIL
jgi:hypothetical protein